VRVVETGKLREETLGLEATATATVAEEVEEAATGRS
jgi:hypothetical protein